MDDAEKKALKILLEAMVMRSRMRAMVAKE